MTNLYWPIYKGIEAEVLAIANTVHFDDKQLSVYSVKIAELIVRCAVEVESISKDLYFTFGGKNSDNGTLYFDTDCLAFLEKQFLISKKTLIINNPNIHCEDKDNLIITPLHKSHRQGDRSSNWKKAYQAIKHERSTSLPRANIRNLLSAIGALFILNIYYANKTYQLKKDSAATTFPINCGSELFAIKIHTPTSYNEDGRYPKKTDFDECIYISKWKSDSQARLQEALQTTNQDNIRESIKHPKMIEWLNTNHIENYKGKNLLLDVLGRDEYIKIINKSAHKLISASNAIEYEAVINTERYLHE